MKSLRTAAIILFFIAGLTAFNGLVEIFIYSTDSSVVSNAKGLASIGAAFGLFVSALIVTGAADIAAAVIDLLGEQAQALRIIVGRRGDKR